MHISAAPEKSRKGGQEVGVENLSNRQKLSSRKSSMAAGALKYDHKQLSRGSIYGNQDEKENQINYEDSHNVAQLNTEVVLVFVLRSLKKVP